LKTSYHYAINYHPLTLVYPYVHLNTTSFIYCLQEEFEDTKGVIRIRISKKNRQHNGQKRKYKRTNNDL